MICDSKEFNLPNLSPENRSAEIAARCAAINSYRILDTPPEPEYEDITKLVATVCDAPIAAISFVCKDRQWFKSEVGLGVCEVRP